MDAAKAKSSVDPRRYFEGVRTDSNQPQHDPVCLYLETTNRCNLLCTTCPRTYEELEPPADMSWQLFCSIVDQIPNLARAVLHGVGEPMLVKNLPRMVRYLKDRGTYVLFNTNGTVLNEKNGRALIEAELDELRVSFDAANAESYKAIRGKNYFNRILKNVRAFRDLQEREGHGKPRVSAWLTGLRETVEQLPEFVRVAAEAGVREVYLQRLVFFEENAIGMARADQALYERLSREEASYLERATEIAAALGIAFSASGAASEPRMSSSVAITARHGRCAAARGPSCTSPRMAALCPAASRRSRSAATRITRSAMPPSRPCGKSGKARHIRHSGARCSQISHPGPAPIAACAGVCDRAAGTKIANAASLRIAGEVVARTAGFGPQIVCERKSGRRDSDTQRSGVHWRGYRGPAAPSR